VYFCRPLEASIRFSAIPVANPVSTQRLTVSRGPERSQIRTWHYFIPVRCLSHLSSLILIYCTLNAYLTVVYLWSEKKYKLPQTFFRPPVGGQWDRRDSSPPPPPPPKLDQAKSIVGWVALVHLSARPKLLNCFRSGREVALRHTLHTCVHSSCQPCFSLPPHGTDIHTVIHPI
jgi:hypothetical protein